MSQEKLSKKLLALVRKRSFLRCLVASQDFSTLAQNERYFSVPSHQLTKLSLHQTWRLVHKSATLVDFSYPTLSQTWPEIYFRPPCAFKTSVFMCPAVHTSARS